MQHVAVPNGTLNVYAQGKGTPLLFVHGFPLNNSMWQPQAEMFSKRNRVIVPDLRGFGESTVTTGTVTMEEFADDLHGVLHGVWVDTPVVLCGLSMGGYVAWQFFRKYRPQLRALILCDTRATADSPEAAAGRHKLAETVLATGSQAASDAMLPKLMSSKTVERWPDLVASVRSMIVRNKPTGIAAAALGMAERPDCTDLLSQIDVPTLVICGQDDQITPSADMQKMAEAIPGAQFVQIPNAGHLAPLENPDAVNGAINRFLISLDARPAS
ncbi:MAG TPA: alpha/beta fold hydrolase [Planctomycetaceae bacterium]|jgi:3-oxoadipate enol-lactonase|nr:alpha/beta fold hydrolase [Planctomycetaceae bacterium]